MKWILLKLILIYKRTLSPLIGSACRFYPSCSEYAYEAICKHGTLKGSWLAFKRLIKCGPWHPGGPDFIP